MSYHNVNNIAEADLAGCRPVVKDPVNFGTPQNILLTGSLGMKSKLKGKLFCNYKHASSAGIFKATSNKNSNVSCHDCGISETVDQL